MFITNFIYKISFWRVIFVTPNVLFLETFTNFTIERYYSVIDTLYCTQRVDDYHNENLNLLYGNGQTGLFDSTKNKQSYTVSMVFKVSTF